ncbi:hypothetical protein M3612_25335 [Niallia taxi]|uniref:hypothetical protein n=1 Tax=Niallia taxi TaxID=2499688 RepID=UPI002041D849|nr:hypothetical protein [Niallia taxi]MCM3217798.1 hypothetical protein [Niallia taxi]
MENTLEMRIEASFSLNFLVYIQNIYINQNQNKDQLKFPYIAFKYGFPKDFEKRYRELWSEISKRVSSEHPINDIFNEEKNIIYQSLFTEDDVTLNEFEEIYLSFKVWWNSLAGRFSIERSIDAPLDEVYRLFANLLIEKRIKPKKSLDISLIYDECLLGDIKPTFYFSIFTIDDWFINRKKLIPKLQLSIH